MSEERELVKKRGSFKGRLTAFISYLDVSCDKQLTSCEVKELQLRMGRIESLYEQYDEVQLRLECMVEDVKAQFSERAEFESQYYKALSRSQELLSKYTNDDKESFLRDRAVLLETLDLKFNTINSTQNKPSSHSNKIKSTSMVVSQNSPSSSTDINKLCPHCKGDHVLSSCSQFLALSIDARLKLIPNYKVCYNCFHTGHFANRCRKPGCKVCKRRHNTLIHSDNKGASTSRDNNVAHSSTPHSIRTSSPTDAVARTNVTANNLTLAADVVGSSCGERKQHCGGVLLSTALIKLCDQYDRQHIVRALLDSGSTSCFMTEHLCKRLNLDACQVNGSVYGINNVSSRVGKMCHIKMTSLDNSYSSKFYCFVLPSLTGVVPCREVDISDLNIPGDICLADPTFYKPSEVDILIGADLFWDLVGSQTIRLGVGKPVLCQTVLGWIVSGPVTYRNGSKSADIVCNFTQSDSSSVDNFNKIHTDLVKFWNLEEVNSQSSNYLPEEKLCEEHFVKNTTRLDSGHFCVRIPLKQSPSVLAEIIIHDFYVDDLLTGADDIHELEFIRAKVTNALASACMPLRKWRSNVPELVHGDSHPDRQEPCRPTISWHGY
ncbi:hypothetical protein HF086_018080 [Spodoptera exigua]|uniref:CCHC-type domain-containing protein n=1 Tax=Spodoptera exigua TaxID=7107 RepID=A0A922SKD5_SPOEX|nr:hypothetical protein HF086_018080 [Spodoptera exigua]